MTILDRYIGRTVFFGTLTALAVLLALYIFMTYIGELQKVGQGQYTALRALQFGTLASNSELTVMRAAGISVMRITWAVMKVALLMMVAVVLIGEGLASHAEQYAYKLRASAMGKHVSVNTGSGLWIREGDEAKRPLTLTYAPEAIYEEGGWILKESAQTRFGEPRITTRRESETLWRGILEPGLIDVVAVEPEGLSTRELLRYIAYLEANGLDSARYWVAFWSKLASPLATGAMMLLAIPFIFGSMRSATMGSRLLTGTLIGIGFYLFNRGLGQLGIVYSIPPFLSATLPTICASSGSGSGARRMPSPTANSIPPPGSGRIHPGKRWQRWSPAGNGPCSRRAFGRATGSPSCWATAGSGSHSTRPPSVWGWWWYRCSSTTIRKTSPMCWTIAAPGCC